MSDWEVEFDRTFEADKSGEQVDGYLLMNTGKWVEGDDREWCKIATPEDVKGFVRKCLAKAEAELVHERRERNRLNESLISALDMVDQARAERDQATAEAAVLRECLQEYLDIQSLSFGQIKHKYGTQKAETAWDAPQWIIEQSAQEILDSATPLAAAQVERIKGLEEVCMIVRRLSDNWRIGGNTVPAIRAMDELRAALNALDKQEAKG